MNFPGTPTHQNILKAISDHYENEPSIRAVTVFGSLARGNWDQYSDLDMDIVVRDGIVLDPVEEVQNMASALNSAGEKLSLVIPAGDEEVDIVLESLAEISLRYHPLATTKHAIIENLIRIAGDIDLEAIKKAGLANYSEQSNSPNLALDKCFRYAIEVNTAIERKRIWIGVELIHRIRGLLMDIYALTSNGDRTIQHFDKTAPTELSDILALTLPQANTLPQTLENILNIFENEIPRFSNGQLNLQPQHRVIIEKLRSNNN